MEHIDMNNAAVCALQQGRPEHALGLLSMALASLKDHFTKRQQPGMVQEFTMMPATITQPPPPTKTENPSPWRQHPYFIFDAAIRTEIEHYGDTMLDEGLVVVPSVLSVTFGALSSHNDGLVLNYNKALMVLHCLYDIDVLASVLLYNMAIVYHSRAIASGSSTLLTNALELYRLATDGIKSTRQYIDRASDFVLLVSYHNMAHIYSSLFYPEEMRDCFVTTSFLLTQESTHRFLDNDDRHFFLISAMLKVGDIRLAPAA